MSNTLMRSAISTARLDEPAPWVRFSLPILCWVSLASTQPTNSLTYICCKIWHPPDAALRDSAGFPSTNQTDCRGDFRSGMLRKRESPLHWTAQGGLTPHTENAGNTSLTLPLCPINNRPVPLPSGTLRERRRDFKKTIDISGKEGVGSRE